MNYVMIETLNTLIFNLYDWSTLEKFHGDAPILSMSITYQKQHYTKKFVYNFVVLVGYPRIAESKMCVNWLFWLTILVGTAGSPLMALFPHRHIGDATFMCCISSLNSIGSVLYLYSFLMIICWNCWHRYETVYIKFISS